MENAEIQLFVFVETIKTVASLDQLPTNLREKNMVTEVSYYTGESVPQSTTLTDLRTNSRSESGCGDRRCSASEIETGGVPELELETGYGGNVRKKNSQNFWPFVSNPGFPW